MATDTNLKKQPQRQMPNWGQRGTTGVSFAAGLSFDGISAAYDKTPALDDVSLDILPGEIICLLGQSGCGKTTLLKIAAGIMQPTAGKVTLDNQVISSPKELVPPEHRGVGLVFQDFALFSHMTVLKNVMYGLDNYSKADAKARAYQTLARVGLDDRADEYPHELSGGQQQRVALARAIAPRPGVLLMDEPFSGLDPRLREDMRAETLTVLRETGATSVIVTHDPEEALLMGDRIALMHHGKIHQTGTPEQLYSEPKDLFSAQFFSNLGIFDAEVNGGRIVTPFGDISVQGFEEGHRVKVALRPHATTVTKADKGAIARIISSRFAGTGDLLELAVAGIDQPLMARTFEKGSFLPGDNVKITLEPKDVLVFSSE